MFDRIPFLIASAVSSLGRICGWLLLVLVLLQFSVIAIRTGFGANLLWAQEAVTYIHASIFMLASAWSLLAGKHVRIDILSDRLGVLGQAKIVRLGTVFFLLPMMVLIAVVSWPYVAESWSILEGSQEVSGLPGRFLFKTLIPAFAILMILAGLLVAFRKRVAG